MFRRVDQSRRLARLIEFVSSFLARRRGLPVVIGIALVIVSFVFQLVNVYVRSQFIELVTIIAQNVGILTALIGLLLAEPLGK